MNLAKVKQRLGTSVADEMDAMKTEALRDVIVEAEGAIAESDREKDRDEKLAGAKEIVKDLASGYREVTLAQRAKISYALYLLEQAGAGTGARVATVEKTVAKLKSEMKRTGATVTVIAGGHTAKL